MTSPGGSLPERDASKPDPSKPDPSRPAAPPPRVDPSRAAPSSPDADRRLTPRSAGEVASTGRISPAIWIVGAVVLIAAIVLGMRMF